MMFSAAFLLGIFSGIIMCIIVFVLRTQYERKELYKMREFYKVLVKWIKLKHRSIGLEEFFNERNMNRVVIYGVKELGELLYAELKHSSVEVVQLVDNDADKMYVDADMDVHQPGLLVADADVIVVTAIAEYRKIQDSLKGKTKIPVVSLSQVTSSFRIY